MTYLLFVDDDLAFLKINRTYFEKLNYTVFTAVNRSEMKQILQNQPIDCIILDIKIPGKGNDGYSLCKRVKRAQMIPIIFLTCLKEKEYLYQGFDAGADDFMTKPYELKELELRIQARINPMTGQQSETLSFPPLTIESNVRKAFINGKPLALTVHEFDILLLLARSPKNIYSMAEIYQLIWKLPDINSVKTVRVHIANMRHKLEDACPDYRFIQLSWGKGFFFEVLKKKEDIS